MAASNSVELQLGVPNAGASEAVSDVHTWHDKMASPRTSLIGPLPRTKVVLGEIQNVIAAMRGNSRWSDPSRNAKAGDPLWANVVLLKQKLETGAFRDNSISVSDFLSPFSEIIVSEIANGPITSVALSSLLKFMQYGYFDISNGIQSLSALEQVVLAAMKCKFEASDAESDAVVMFKVLKVLQRTIDVDTALLLSDKMLYDMVQTCFKLSIQGRVSLLLRKAAEMALTEIFQFACVGTDSPLKTHLSALHFPQEILDLALKEDSETTPTDEASAETVRVNPQGVSFVKDSSSPSLATPNNSAAATPTGTPVKSPSASSLSAVKARSSSSNISVAPYVPTAPPFGVNGLIKMVRFLCTMINPRDPSTTEPMRYLGLTMVNGVIETRGASLSDHKRLLDVITNDVCRFLIQSVRCEQNNTLLSLTMRVCYNLFSNLMKGGLLGFQLDLFIRSVIAFFPDWEPDVLKPPPPKSAAPVNPKGTAATSPEPQRSFLHQELALDALAQLCRDPAFPLDLLLRYDCQVTGLNLFEILVKFFENICDPRYERADAILENMMVFRSQANAALGAILSSMSTRFMQIKEHKVISPHIDTQATVVETMQFGTVPSALALSDRRALKNTLKVGADQFNAKPKEGLKYLTEKGVLPTPLTADSVSHFLRTNPFVNKTVIGEYFAERNDFNKEVLKQYCLSFDWDTKPFFEVFRQFLESFRLPGEAPVIEKILDVWTRLYYGKYDEEVPLDDSEITEEGAKRTKTVNHHPIFLSLDACYVICTSIVLLNVDMYNPNVKQARRMNIDQYVHNLRGQNNKQNFPPEFLRAIYTEIRASEISIAEERVQSSTSDIPQGTWQSLWTRQQANFGANSTPSRLEASLQAGVLYGLYDELLFSEIWKVLITTTKEIWTQTSYKNSAELFDRLSASLYAIGNLAAHFSNSTALDGLVAALTEISTILQPYKLYSFEVRFMQDKKAQMATAVLFDLAHQHANVIREGWKSINDLMIALQTLAVLPPIWEEVADDRLFQFKDLPPPAGALPVAPQATGSSVVGGLWSSLWKWGSNAAGLESITKARENNTLPPELDRYRNAVKQLLIDCHLPDVITACARVEPDSLLFFMQVLIIGSAPAPISRSAPSPVAHTTSETPQKDPSPEAAPEAAQEQGLADDFVNILDSESPQPLPEKSSSPTPSITPQESELKASNGAPPKVHMLSQQTITAQTHRRLAPRLGASSKNRFEDPVALYCVDMLAHLALLNVHRVALIWPIVSSHFAEIISMSDKPTPLTERAITNLLIVVAKLLPAAVGVPSLIYGAESSETINSQSSVAFSMSRTLQQSLVPSALGSELSKAYSHKISHAMRVILRRNAKAIGGNATAVEWQSLLDAVADNMFDTPEHMENFVDVLASSVVRGIIPESLATSASVFTARTEPSSAAAKLDLSSLASTLVTTHNIRAVHSSILKLLTAVGASIDALAEGMDCAQALLILGPQRLSGSPSDPVWHGYMLNSFVLPIFSVMASLTHDSRIVVRQNALSHLQKAFCSSGLSFASSDDWAVLFNKIIFPLLDGLLPPAQEGQKTPLTSSSSSTREATEEALMRAVAVLSKTYLHCMTTVSPSVLAHIWNQSLIRSVAFYKNSGSEVVQEAVVQSVKNTLSVMQSSGILLTSVPPRLETQTDDEYAQVQARGQIWTESWPLVDQIAPLIRHDFSARGVPLPPAVASSVASAAPLQAQLPPQTVQPTPQAPQPSVQPASPSKESNAEQQPRTPSSPPPARTASPVNPPGTVLEL